MKVKVSEATGPVLDWMVAEAEGQLKYITFDFDLTHPLIISGVQSWGPSFIWSQGGPIIEREDMTVGPTGDPTIPQGAWMCFDNQKFWMAGRLT